MKKSGFTLMELVVVIAIIGILAVTLAPRLANQRAKAEGAKAIALLGALRTQSEVYYTDEGEKPYGELLPGTPNRHDKVQDEDKGGLNILIPRLSNDAINMFGENYTVKAGGARDKPGDEPFLDVEIGFTFSAPAGESADGISLWFTQMTTFPVNYEYDTKGKAWIEY